MDADPSIEPETRLPLAINFGTQAKHLIKSTITVLGDAHANVVFTVILHHIFQGT